MINFGTATDNTQTDIDFQSLDESRSRSPIQSGDFIRQEKSKKIENYKVQIDLKENNIIASQRMEFEPKVDIKIYDVLFGAYLSVLRELFTNMLTDGKYNSITTGKIIEASEKYLVTLEPANSYRLFLTNIILIVRNNYKFIDADKISKIVIIIDELINSKNKSEDCAKSLLKIYKIGLKPVKIVV